MRSRRELMALVAAGAASQVVFGEGVLAHARPDEQGGPPTERLFAATATYVFDPRRTAEVIDTWENAVLAAARQAPGFVRGLLLTNDETGIGLGMGLFASKAAADAFGATEAFQAANARLQAVLLAEGPREEYDARLS